MQARRTSHIAGIGAFDEPRPRLAAQLGPIEHMVVVRVADDHIIRTRDQVPN